MPLAYAIAFDAAGLVAGLYFVWRMQDQLKSRGASGYLAVIGMPVMTIVAASFGGRALYEAIGFTGVTPTDITVNAPVVDMTSGRSGRRAIIKVDPASREIWVDVTSGLFSRLDAYRHPGRDCLKLHVQAGRFGIRRAIVPGFLNDDVDVDRFGACPAKVAAWAVPVRDEP